MDLLHCQSHCVSCLLLLSRLFALSTVSTRWPLVCPAKTSTSDTNDDLLHRKPTVSPSPPALPPQTTDTFNANCHKKPRPEAYKQHGNGNESLALPKLMAELWKPLVHPITERVFVTDKGERFEVPIDQVRWKKPLGKRVVIVDTDTRLDGKTENTMLNECPLDFTTLPGRTGGHLNHYIYGTVYQLWCIMLC